MDIKELERIMVSSGLVIRAIPEKVTKIFESRHIKEYPEGVIKFMEQYKREMLVVEHVPENAGKFIFEYCGDTNSIVTFKPKEYFDSIEQCINYILGYYITPSGKVMSKLIPETDKDYKLLGLKKMIKVWTIYMDGQAGWTTDSPIEFVGEICEETGIAQREVENIIKVSVEQSKPGDSDHIRNYEIKCSEMEEEEFKTLEEFTGW